MAAAAVTTSKPMLEESHGIMADDYRANGKRESSKLSHSLAPEPVADMNRRLWPVAIIPAALTRKSGSLLRNGNICAHHLPVVASLAYKAGERQGETPGSHPHGVPHLRGELVNDATITCPLNLRAAFPADAQAV